MLHYASIMLYAFHAKNYAGIIDASLHATDLKFSYNASINNVTKCLKLIAHSYIELCSKL